jgi:hypothetical protein
VSKFGTGIVKFTSTKPLLRSFISITCVVAQTLSITVSAQEAPPVVAADDVQAVRPAAIVRDVSLEADGRLQLRLLDRSGQAQAGRIVQCLFQDQLIARGKTDATGRVTITSLRPGIHTITAAGTVTAYRLWNKDSAPPSAISSPAIVASDEALRGQYGYGPPPMMAPGMLATGVTLAAVVAVLAGKNSGSKSSLAPPASP